MKKLYYSIGEVSEITDVEPHILRYWETRFDSLKPAKNRSGKRMYTDGDIETVIRLKGLIREKKYSTAGARQVIEGGNTRSNGTSDHKPLPAGVVRDLKEVKLFLEKLMHQL